MPPTIIKPYYSIWEASAIMGMAHSRLSRLIKSGDIKADNVTGYKKPVISYSCIKEYLAKAGIISDADIKQRFEYGEKKWKAHLQRIRKK